MSASLGINLEGKLTKQQILELAKNAILDSSELTPSVRFKVTMIVLSYLIEALVPDAEKKKTGSTI